MYSYILNIQCRIYIVYFAINIFFKLKSYNYCLIHTICSIKSFFSSDMFVLHFYALNNSSYKSYYSASQLLIIGGSKSTVFMQYAIRNMEEITRRVESKLVATQPIAGLLDPSSPPSFVSLISVFALTAPCALQLR